MHKTRLHIIRIFALLMLLLCGIANEAWADVTYIILTKEFSVKNSDNSTYKWTNIRLEALRCTSTETTVRLPDAFRSPLAKNFQYWRTATVTANTKLYDDTGTSPKVLQTGYDIYTAVSTELTENDPVPDGVATIYVTYDYDDTNNILKLDGAHKYNIALNSGNNLRYLCLNKNRNNRPAAALATTVSAEDLISDDFVTNVNGFDGTKSVHYQFYLCGEDPYNITIMSAYEGDGTYTETLAVEKTAYKKPYRGSTIFAKLQSNNNNDGTANMWLSPDAHRHYKSTTDATVYDSWEGFYKSDMNPIFNAVAVLPKGSGYFFVASKLNQNGKIYQPNASGYYATLSDDGKNPRMLFKAISSAVPMEPDPVTTYTFNVKTAFGNTISATAEWSDAYIDAEITTSHIPESLKRKYCSFVGFYKDAALTQAITKFSDVPADGNIYVKYEVSGAPFTAISPSASYTTATWYELTDAGSNQASGKKLKYDGTNSVFKNNGANAAYDKLSEFAFVGDPYELRVLYRNATETASAKRYVSGATNLGVSASDPATSSSDFTYGTSYTYNTENLASGKKTLTFKISGLNGSKKIKVTKGGTDATQVDSSTPTLNEVVVESSTTETVTVTLNANVGVAKTMTVTIQEYETDGTTPSGTATVVTINQAAEAWSWDIPYDNTDGSFELRQYGTDSESTTKMYWQWTTGSAGNNITINTTSTRVKVMELPKFTYTYNVVDLAGNIAIKATAVQTIFTPISGYASIPETIRSPFLADETITFYGSYTDRNGDGKRDRRDWHYSYSAGTYTPSEQPTLTETPGTGDADIFVSYTTTHLTEKTIKLLYTEEFNVKLNGEYIYWNSESGDDQNKILSSNLAANADKLSKSAYLWHLRGRDPYAMRIDNKGYSEQQFGNPISTTTSNFYDPNGNGALTSGSPETIANGMFVRVKDGIWGNDKALEFVNSRDNGSRFIAMMGGYAGVYEVLAATGTTELYHIGRVSTTGAETKIYSNATYAHGSDQLRFELTGSTVTTYTLIDKAKNELFTVESKNPRLALPPEYQSPLVDTYYYYPTKAKAITDNHSDNINEITNDTNESDGTPADNHVWVTYTVNDLVSFNTSSSTKNNPYLLRFHNGSSYHLEDGADKLTTGAKIKAMYPYCNGDGNLNVYGEAMRDEQMDGGTSTRSRWQWFFESANSDPYHVKIHSNNQITTPLGKDYTYLHTYAVHFNQDADPSTTHIVTGSTLPGVWKPATEYMVLGTAGNYKLLTTDAVPIDLNDDGDTEDEGESAGERQYVTSFEQYWKTYNMIKQHLLGLNHDDPAKEPYDDEFSEDPSTFVMPSAKWSDLKAALTAKGVNDADDLNYVDGSSWHSYDAIANAVRWNGYNDKENGHKSKKVEELEHWFQSFYMGDGTFAIENGEIPPVLVLLDRHGWEIMRKPIPTGSSDPEAETKLAALKVFDSPMVKEYKFYSNANKVSNCHKFHLRMQNGAERDPIKVGGVHFTSTSLGTLPPYVADRDLFVIYTVKEEYEKSYRYNLTYTGDKDTGYTITSETGTPSAFIVLQNHMYASDDGSGTSIDVTTAPSPLSDEIIADASKEEASKTFKQKCLWYLQPNLDIDDEMGIPRPWRDASDPDKFYGEDETKVLFKDKTGFDPYNLQLKNVSTDKFFTTHMTRSVLNSGAYTGVYTGEGGSTNVTLSATTTPISSPESYDHSTLKMTNQTFMAVQDENGNMQLMPRFDHSHRINAFTILADPLTNATKAAVDDASPGAQTTFLVRPQVFDYKVIDNQGNVALRYKTGGEFYPSMPEHFKSPLATDFKFYKTLLDSNSDGVYELASLDDEITSSFAAAGIMDNADIYIRYDYNDTYDTDNQNILQGQWLTMSLGAKDVQATGTLSTDGTGISLYTGTKDASVNKWQWKFLQSPMASTSELYVAPDPYRVIISNREANNDDPTAPSSKMATAIKISGKDKFVILSHPSGDYALCAAGDGLTYSFLNGGSMTEPSTTAASVEEEGSFTKTSNTISAGARIIFTEDVTHTYTYYIINNSSKLAASETQDNATALSNEFKPVVPYNIQSPLINNDDYLFYTTAKINNNSTPGDPSDDTYTIDSDVEKFVIDNLYGLFDDKVYVRYPEFSRDNTPYLVPNARNASSPVEVGSGSNDVAIDINGNLPYNIIWLDDNMMRSTDGTNITDGGDNSHNLSGETADKWHFTGDDPYAIKIKHDSGDMYIDGDGSLNATAKNYMLLKKDGYDYGVFAETGNRANMLTFSGSPKTLATTTSDPAKFIPFALSVHHLIYRLIIAKSCANHASPNTGESVDIPYRTGDENTYQTSGTWSNQMTTIYGSTQRDLSSTTTVTGDTYQLGRTIYFKDTNSSDTESKTYCYDAGKVSLGDVLEVPSELKRPNCKYSYYVQDIYDNYNEVYDASTGASTGGSDKRCESLNTGLNNKYKGLKMDDNNPVFIKKSDLIGKTVVVNITYDFDAGLETNSGTGFVTDVSQNRWYTWEANAATPKLAQYTGSLQTQSGYATHYTNDYLWTPLGDPYGFKMYNRYLYKNLSNSSVMTSTTVSVETDILMSTDNTANSVYELLASNTAGYFRVHPVVNTGATKYFMRDDNGTLILSTTATEWTYGLSEDVMRPYYEGAGNVGGLNAAGKAAYETEAARTNPLERLMGIQDVVYNHDLADDNPDNYIVHYTPGYYRLHNQPGSEGISTIRYASGYLHDIEKTAVSGGIPMHFYSRAGTSTTFAGEGGLGSGFTSTAATQGEIPVPATEYDPSTIFYFSGSSGSINISTQGLNVVGNKMTASTGTAFTLTDIGGAVVALSNSTDYLCYKQDGNIYDLKFGSYSSMESARWCMEPANKQGLLIETHSGGDGYYYSTFCAPYDVTLPTDAGGKTYNAYVCTTWNTDNIHPTSIGKTITAGTPAIIRTTDTSGSVKVTLPGTASSAASCVFTGKYLEQLLATITADDKVYTFGLPITGYNLSVAGDATNGEVTNPLEGSEPAYTGVGFYLNATKNKEKSATSGEWTPNNRYVLHNKIYYRSGSSGSSAREQTDSEAPQFVPVIFDFDGEEEEGCIEEGLTPRMQGDNHVYDLSGRCVATPEQVADGSWWQNLSHGIYILNGHKIIKK